MTATVTETSAATYDNSVTVRSPAPRKRIASIDIIRGAVMVLMAIDHVRVFAGVPTYGTPPVFFTRWVTHFCAPVFIFLAGTAAFLYGQKVGSRTSLAKFLMLRGVWLILLELTLLRFGWTFNFDYANFTFAGVIWAIGWSMVILGGLAFLPAAIVGAIGLIIILGHNAIAPLVESIESPSVLLRILYAGGNFEVARANVAVLYVLVPWIGAMTAGYGFGQVMVLERERRRRICLSLGIAAVAAFLVLRFAGIYGDPRPWQPGQGALSFLNPAKYPASLLFMLMTLGPMMIAIPLLENARGKVAQWLRVFGEVPFFYYVLHIPLIHLVAVLISQVRTPASTGWLFTNHPMMPPEVPPGYQWSLQLLYLVAALVVTVLYFACRWFAEVKAKSSNPLVRFF
ncbi:MAG TPA: heparan-alpha-glucosaminide N-acetyltransferase domain-containing protein [Gemmatimonadaceae bacterium]|nr:heparan-alpha-glucosaminide N-acetyltransferase domain-containing protein [Gemmatimonadaceae bacterium]